MSDAERGWAIWPSGDSWLLLRTTDGWHTVTNATPVAVPTGGGLVVDNAGATVAVAVGAYERLLRSPVLTKPAIAAQWRANELPGAIMNDRNALSLAGQRLSAIITRAGGTVVMAQRNGWNTLVSANSLDPDGRLLLGTVSWANSRIGWVTGRGWLGAPVAFQTTDGGHRWRPIQVAGVAPVEALAPCGEGRRWLLPVIGRGRIALERTTDNGRHWYAGTSLPLPSGSPAWGCHGDHVWLEARSGKSQHVFASDDGGQTWAERGPAPRGLSSLVPGPGGSGFAASRTAETTAMWVVTGDGRHFVPRALPGWVATLGAQESGS
jgi:photosystem II stability/assembly factor-like uncharacterized protein